MTIRQAIKRMLPHLTDDLRRKPWKGNKNNLAGHCYVASETLFYLFPGRFKPMVMRYKGNTHWWLFDKKTGDMVDPTAGQFSSVPPYQKGRGNGFLTNIPSKRTSVVISRMFRS